MSLQDLRPRVDGPDDAARPHQTKHQTLRISMSAAINRRRLNHINFKSSILNASAA
jgi:hypothetical protein